MEIALDNIEGFQLAHIENLNDHIQGVSMKSLVCTHPGKLEYQKRSVPLLKPGYSLVKVKRISICESDLEGFEGKQPFMKYPRVLGHELAGDLVDPNGAPGFEAGESVAFMPYYNCGTCTACRLNKPNCCINLKLSGVHVDGGMSEYIMVPFRSLIHGRELTYDELALIEPLAVGAHAVRRANVQPGEHVLVIGAGQVGLGIMEFVRIAGGKVIVMDADFQRLDFCREKLGIELTIDPAQDVNKILMDFTQGNMPSVVIDSTGIQRIIHRAFKYISFGGRYVLAGFQPKEVVFSHPDLHLREATLMSSTNATRSDFEHVIERIANQELDVSKYITHRIDFDDLIDDFEPLLNPGKGVLRAMVTI